MLSLLPPFVTLAIILSAAPTPTRPPPAAADWWVEETLASMSVRDKAAQMVMPWIPGGTIGGRAERTRIERLVREHRVGGFIVGRGDGAATQRTIARLQQLSDVPLFIGADVERGAGMRLVGATSLAPHMALGATGDEELARRQGYATAIESRRAGIHLAFAPVADVNIDPSNPIINTRAFGSEPRAVARFVAAYVRGLQEGGMLAVAKHFPGHGDTRTDSHLALPVIDASRARLDSVELVPFRAAIAAGTAGIMSAHIAVPALSGVREPATLSRLVLTGVLREELGFEGLIVTDALTMAGVERFAEEADVVLRAVLAGADILLQPRDPALAIDVLVEAVRRGDVPTTRLDASVRRILHAKARLGLQASTAAPPMEVAEVEHIRQRHRALAGEIADRSIVLVRDDSALVPARDARSAVWIHYVDRGATGAIALDAALREAGWSVERISIRRGAPAAQVVAAERAATAADANGRLVIISSVTQAVPWGGRTALPSRFRGLVARLSASRPVVYISFGDPYLLSAFPDVAAYLLAWSDAEAQQQAAARALMGRIAITGTLPIELPPLHDAGFGLVRSP
jgi:beta-N-acetylhexosaminidase